MTRRVDLSEFRAGFVAESEDHLRSCRASLLEIDAAARQGRPSPKAVRDLYRSFHTIKGLAAMVGVEPIVELAHHIEDVLRAADRAGGALSAKAADLMVHGLESLEKRVHAVGRQEEVSAAPQRLLDELEALASRREEPQRATGTELALEPALRDRLTASETTQIVEGARRGRRAVRLDFVPTPERAARGVTITTVRERLSELGEIVRVVPTPRAHSEGTPVGLAFALLIVTDADDAALIDAVGAGHDEPIPIAPLIVEPDTLRQETPEVTSHAMTGGAAVRVDVGRLDEGLRALSSLLVTGFRLSRAVDALPHDGPEWGELRAVADEQARQLRDMRKALLQLRMIPVEDVLARIPLIVRGLRASTGKSVRAHIEATGAEVDKAVADRVFPALVHLVRNAVDHGIEPPPERRERGKPEEGNVWIRVSEPAGDRLQIEIADDGAGIDEEAIAARLGQPRPRDDAELLTMLASRGMTTRDEATTTSGRGLGVDIIQRTVVRELGGNLSLRNEPGRGATFALRIPFTISIIEALSFVSAGRPFVVPLSSVDEIAELDELRSVAAPSPSRAASPIRLVQRRGRVVPYVELAEVFELDRHEAQSRKAIFIHQDGETYAFGVDRMLGQQEVVLRPLDDPLVRVPGVAGSTDLGDGRPTLVLDLVALGRGLANRPSEEARR